MGSIAAWLGAMEGNAHLLQVIRKMRSQINKLERENRALRGELQVCGQRTAPAERGAARGGRNGDLRSLANDGEEPAGSPASLHGSIVAGPASAPEEQTGTTEPGLPTASVCAAHRAAPGRAVTCPWGMGDELPAVCLVGSALEKLHGSPLVFCSADTQNHINQVSKSVIFLRGYPQPPS